MPSLPSILAGILGLGGPDLNVIFSIFSLVTAPVSLVVVVLFFRSRSSDAARAISSEPCKKCPDCSEFVLIEAHACKHCGRRFDAAPARTA